MSTKDLYDMLINAGVEPDKAQRRADEYIKDQQMNETLSKSLEALEEVAEAQRATEIQHQDRLSKAFNEGESSISEMIAPALDSLLEEQRAQNEALCKSFKGVLELIKGMREEIKGLRRERPTQEAQPMAKSLDYIPAPGDIQPGSSDAREDLFKALAQESTSSPDRAGELLHAVALLEGGANPTEIKQRFLG